VKAKVIKGIKKWGHIIWNTPGVKNAVAAGVVKVIVRVGLPAGIGAVVIAVAEAVAGGL
jgi:hypothetical protein